MPAIRSRGRFRWSPEKRRSACSSERRVMHPNRLRPAASQESKPRRACKSRPARQNGMTLLELIVATGILLTLASAALPIARATIRHQREVELRRALREMRTAIDRYKDAADKNLIRVEVGTEGYPPDLDTLVKGVDLVSQQGGGIAGATTPGQPLVPSTGFGGAFGGFGSSFGQTQAQGQNSGSSQGQ